jgi:hypothetical protein
MSSTRYGGSLGFTPQAVILRNSFRTNKMSGRLRTSAIACDADKPRWTVERILRFYPSAELRRLFDYVTDPETGAAIVTEQCGKPAVEMKHPHEKFIHFYAQGLSTNNTNLLYALSQSVDRPMEIMGLKRPAFNDDVCIPHQMQAISFKLMKKETDSGVEDHPLYPIGMGHNSYRAKCRVREGDGGTSLYVMSIQYADRATYEPFIPMEVRHIAFTLINLINVTVPSTDVVYINFSVYAGAKGAGGLDIYHSLPPGLGNMRFDPFAACYDLLCHLLRTYKNVTRIVASVRNYRLTSYDLLTVQSEEVIVSAASRYT